MLIIGVIYLGASAGTHIATSNIEHVLNFDDNNVNVTEYTGIGLIDGIVICHYDESRKKIADMLKLKGEYNVYTLKDDQIIYSNGEKISII